MNSRLPPLRVLRIQGRFASELLIGAVIASLPAGASGLSSLSVEAIVGPFPATIGPAGSEFEIEQSITFVIAPNPAFHSLTGGDAEIEVGFTWDGVQPDCTYTGPQQENSCVGTGFYDGLRVTNEV